MAPRDWVEWHRDYDDPGSLLSRRLRLVQGHVRAELGQRLFTFVTRPASPASE